MQKKSLMKLFVFKTGDQDNFLKKRRENPVVQKRLTLGGTGNKGWILWTFLFLVIQLIPVTLFLTHTLSNDDSG